MNRDLPQSKSQSSDKAAPVRRSQSSKETVNANSEGVARELGGPKGPEPTRFGDWERKGRCVDF